ncbi:uncharacterized protein LOC117020061 [Rhinolophus ferrumequinum]|uniref:uncharacterized protein LOC117020061 n=1 Tax=Rhinolophus ferrumequinum TaxID=59479 RepID=UPI00140F8791|nr:uncharacterized protein LOC117020061 [Rhinolophus ferrumequinum]
MTVMDKQKAQIVDVFFLPDLDEGSTCNAVRSRSYEPRTNDSTSISEELAFDVDSKPRIEVKDPVPNQAVGMDDVQRFRPDSSSWKAPSLTLNHGTCEGSRDSKFGDKRPFATRSMSRPLAASTEFRQMTVMDKQKAQIVVDEGSTCNAVRR